MNNDDNLFSLELDEMIFVNILTYIENNPKTNDLKKIFNNKIIKDLENNLDQEIYWYKVIKKFSEIYNNGDDNFVKLFFSQLIDTFSDNRFAVYFLGSTKFGKSTFIYNLVNWEGSENCSEFSITDFNDRFNGDSSLKSLHYDKKLLYTTETTQNKKIYETRFIKNLISKEPYKTEQKGKDKISQVFSGVVIGCSNKKIEFADFNYNDGIRTRFLYFEWNKKLFEKQNEISADYWNKSLLKKTDRVNYNLFKLIQYLKVVLENNNKIINYNELLKKTPIFLNRENFDNSDTVIMFWKSNFEINLIDKLRYHRKKEIFVSGNLFYSEYQQYCINDGYSLNNVKNKNNFKINIVSFLNTCKEKWKFEYNSNPKNSTRLKKDDFKYEIDSSIEKKYEKNNYYKKKCYGIRLKYLKDYE